MEAKFFPWRYKSSVLQKKCPKNTISKGLKCNIYLDNFIFQISPNGTPCQKTSWIKWYKSDNISSGTVDFLDIHGFKFTDVLSLLKHTTLIWLRMKYSIKIDIDD